MLKQFLLLLCCIDKNMEVIVLVVIHPLLVLSTPMTVAQHVAYPRIVKKVIGLNLGLTLKMLMSFIHCIMKIICNLMLYIIFQYH